jgi:hypothetical protein
MVDAAKLLRDVQIFVDDAAPPARERLDIPGDSTIDEVGFALRQQFDAEPDVAALTLAVDDVEAGVVTRRSLGRVEGTAAGDSGPTSAPVGFGERLQLAGDSTEYRLLAFACRQCARTAYRIFYDERDLPACADHGRMELIS